jgi:hypothetical protein
MEKRKPKRMTPLQIRVSIAAYDGVGLFDMHAPDYLNDANAMHKVEATLENNAAERTQYYWELLNVIGRHTSPDQAILASAAQRATAFANYLDKRKSVN